MEASSHCWQGWQGLGPRSPMALEWKGGKVGIVLGAVLRLSVYPSISVLFVKKAVFLTCDWGTWTLLPVAVLEKPWNVSLGRGCERWCSSQPSSSRLWLPLERPLVTVKEAALVGNSFLQLPLYLLFQGNAGMGVGSWLYARTWWR